MSLKPSQLSTLMVGQCYARAIRGTAINRFCQAMSEGIIESFKEMNKVVSVDVGIAAVGKGTGKIIGITPQQLIQITTPLLYANGIRGTKAKDLSEAVCTAVVMHFLAMAVSKTNHTGVAVGSGVGQILNLIPSKMTQKLTTKMMGKQISGVSIVPLVKAFSQGFCIYMMAAAKVTIAIVGSPVLVLGVPIPSGGSGKGKIE